MGTIQDRDEDRMTKRLSRDDIRQRSAANMDKLLRAIRRGKIHTAADAMDVLGVSRAWVSVLVRRARDSGIRIATQTGGAWAIVEDRT